MDPLNKITTNACQTANEARNAFCTGDIGTCKVKLKELGNLLLEWTTTYATNKPKERNPKS